MTTDCMISPIYAMKDVTAFAYSICIQYRLPGTSVHMKGNCFAEEFGGLCQIPSGTQQKQAIHLFKVNNYVTG